LKNNFITKLTIMEKFLGYLYQGKNPREVDGPIITGSAYAYYVYENCELKYVKINDILERVKRSFIEKNIKYNEKNLYKFCIKYLLDKYLYIDIEHETDGEMFKIRNTQKLVPNIKGLPGYIPWNQIRHEYLENGHVKLYHREEPEEPEEPEEHLRPLGTEEPLGPLGNVLCTKYCDIVNTYLSTLSRLGNLLDLNIISIKEYKKLKKIAYKDLNSL